MANPQLTLYVSPLLFATPKLNSDEKNVISCYFLFPRYSKAICVPI